MCNCSQKASNKRQPCSSLSTLQVLMKELTPSSQREFEMDLRGFSAGRTNNICNNIDNLPEGEEIKVKTKKLFNELESISPGLGNRMEEMRNESIGFYSDHCYLMGVLDGVRLVAKLRY